jgi:hypothetical protein
MIYLLAVVAQAVFPDLIFFSGFTRRCFTYLMNE